jgi:Transposase and inactivated derivatives
LTRAEWKKALVVEKILAGQMTNTEGAAALGLTRRQVIRLKNRYVNEGGAQALAHRNRGRKPKHALSEELKDHIAELYTTKYHGSNNCHFVELLEEHESLKLSAPSVRRILLSKGIKQARHRRRKKTHQPRQRKPACCGKSMRPPMPGWRTARRPSPFTPPSMMRQVPLSEPCSGRRNAAKATALS